MEKRWIADGYYRSCITRQYCDFDANVIQRTRSWAHSFSRDVAALVLHTNQRSWRTNHRWYKVLVTTLDLNHSYRLDDYKSIHMVWNTGADLVKHPQLRSRSTIATPIKPSTFNIRFGFYNRHKNIFCNISAAYV